MNQKFKPFTVKYQFIGSFFQNETMTVTALTMKQAIDKVRDEVSKAYGSAILKQTTFNQ